MKFTIEGSSLFPYIAWTAIILFAVFVYLLVNELEKSAAYLADKTQENVEAVNRKN